MAIESWAAGVPKTVIEGGARRPEIEGAHKAALSDKNDALDAKG
jgi:hypothetical protein